MHRVVTPTDDGNSSERLLSQLPALISPQAEASAFRRLRRRIATTLLFQTLSLRRFSVLTTIGLSALLWLTTYVLFDNAFTFVDWAIASPDLHDEAIHNIFGKFFCMLMIMLVFSGGIIIYASTFTGRDAWLMLTLPARAERVFIHKFQEAVLLGGWAFVLLGSPMLVAYGRVGGAPWYYFAMLLPYLAAFIYVPVGLSAVLCLVIVHRLPQFRMHVILAAIGVFLGLAVYGVWSILATTENNLLTPEWFRETMHRLSVTEFRLLPSWWLSAGLLKTARGQWPDGVLFLVLMISNALFVRQLTVWTAAAIYRPAFSRLHGRSVEHRKAAMTRFDDLLARIPFAPREMRLLLIKDFRLFRRDPVQWSQIAIFGGLLAVYFFGAGRYKYDAYWSGWINIVSFLNVTVIGLLLSTFTTRFIFPMISLEGRRFWTLGLLPIRRSTIVWGKFLFAVGSSLPPASLLIFVSDAMLGVDLPILLQHQLTCLLLCFGLSGLAVGLGARIPSLREQSPDRIAAGFGGTLCLILSALYIAAVVLLAAVPCHLYFGANTIPGLLPSVAGMLVARAYLLFVSGIIGSILLGILTTILPLVIGLRSFRHAEF